MIIEVIATSVDDVLQAEAGGADRIELITGLQEGGMTPSIGLIREALAATTLPVHVIVRPHNRSYMYDSFDIRAMVHDIREIRSLGAAGVVIGSLSPDGRIDKEILAPVLEAAQGMNITFNRAFDDAKDLDEALEDVLQLNGVNRLLTSGGQASALDASAKIKQLANRLEGTPVILMAGSGLMPEGIAQFVEATGVSEIHFGRGVRTVMDGIVRVDPEKIRQIRGAFG
ncbi:copper homeostasis protein CutC [Paenibacillus glycanilyticus]|uniref:copper homeostasis protein CutC n=1 Tax=Paenibacillus glycanilyticus TaxID=126569 RepID=UPI00203F0217|nr:copper homeostasis protein CutC [Paenibacillus glycanilyticus]MCM3629713.1 copper homeostasis protein CutC [Paenibacillus glycanilyticus]